MYFEKFKPINFAIFPLNSTPFQEVTKLLNLNHLSKLIERIVHGQAEEFLNKNKIIYRIQSGFQKKLLYKHLSWTSYK